MAVIQRWPAYRGYCDCIVYKGHPWDHAKWLLYRGSLLIEVGGALGLMDFGTYPTGWHIEGDLLSQVAVSTGSTMWQSLVETSQLYLLFCGN